MRARTKCGVPSVAQASVFGQRKSAQLAWPAGLAVYSGPAMGILTADKELDVYDNMAARFDQAAAKLGLDEGLQRVLRSPNKEITVYIPVVMDSGAIEVFVGYRVQHSVVRGPGKGGI